MIDPKTLLSLVENTAPFVFQEKIETPYTKALLHPVEQPDHFAYFELCLSAHYTTVATFVPTDVDNQIRKHLWETDLSWTEKMAELCLASLQWDFRPFTARYQESEHYYVSGHQGEWFSVAVGAYARHRQEKPALAKEVLAQILKELKEESDLFSRLKKQKDGIGLLRACTLIAHNLGDLDRVMDQWDLPADDPLRLQAYKLGHEKNPRFPHEQSSFLEAGQLNKAFMASENHRHYPLRKCKPLRRSLDLLLPVGPFFAEWGKTVATHPLLEPKEIAEIAQALLLGFQKLSSPKIPLYGYARAIGGIAQNFRALTDCLPSRAGKEIRSGLIDQIAKTPHFNEQWNKKALQFLRIS